MSMRQSTVKRKLKAGQQVLVTKACFQDPCVVEIMGLLGLDCVWICSEHKAIDPSVLENMVRAARAANVDTLVRSPRHAYDDLARCLAIGATGLMIPHVERPEDARQIVARAKYPPVGNRQMEHVNADADFGLAPLVQYLQHANEETFLVMQVEDQEAMKRAAEIAAVPGIDVLYVGVMDLSLSMGIPGEVKHPRVVEAIRQIARVCESAHIACGTAAIDPEHCRMLMDEGVRFFTERSDWRALVQNFRGAIEAYSKLGFTFGESR
jgi:4-hydroxy-2-oxoheptanedioate aldolase